MKLANGLRQKSRKCLWSLGRTPILALTTLNRQVAEAQNAVKEEGPAIQKLPPLMAALREYRRYPIKTEFLNIILKLSYEQMLLC